MIHLSDFLKLVGNKIRTLRKAKGLTQEELAEKAGLQYSYIDGIERGERNISLETLEKIINGLEVTAYGVFKFGNLESNELLDKKRKIQSINNLLIERKELEIEMIYRLVKDLINVIDAK